MLRLALVAPLALAALAGCLGSEWGGSAVEGSGVAGSRTVEVAGAEAVRLSVPGELTVTRGAAPLQIEGDDNLVERLEAEVGGTVLVVRAPRGESFRPERPLRMTVGIESLRGVEVAGSGSVVARGVRTDELAVSIGGSGDVRASGLEAGAVSVNIGGSGSVTLDGRADRLAVNVAGSGDVEAEGLAVSDAEVSIAGSGDVTVSPAARLDVSIMGSGDVRYAGSPEVTQSVMGSGDVAPLRR